MTADKVRIAGPTAADIMRSALLRIATTRPAMRGLDPATRADTWRRTFDDVQRMVKDALDGAARADREQNGEAWTRLYRMLDAGDRGEALAIAQADAEGFARGVRAAAAEHTGLAETMEAMARRDAAEGLHGRAEDLRAIARRHRQHAEHLLQLLPAKADRQDDPAPPQRPRFEVLEWRGRWWLDRIGGGVDCRQCVGPFPEREATALAERLNEINRRLDAGEPVQWDDGEGCGACPLCGRQTCIEHVGQPERDGCPRMAQHLAEGG